MEAGYQCLVYSHAVIELLVSHYSLNNVLELMPFDLLVIQPVEVWQVVEGMSAVVAKSAHRIGRVSRVTKREAMQIWQQGELH